MIPACREEGLLEVVLELPAPARVAQLAQRLGLDLPDPLAGDVEVAADLLEGPAAAILEAEAKLEDASLARREAVEHPLHLLLQELVAGRVRRRHAGKIG